MTVFQMDNESTVHLFASSCEKLVRPTWVHSSDQFSKTILCLVHPGLLGLSQSIDLMTGCDELSSVIEKQKDFSYVDDFT